MTNHLHDLVLSRTMAASSAALWRCWTEPQLLERWFCPKPWFVTDARIDLTPGGEFACTMNGPGGEKFPSLGVVLAAEPGKRLVTTDAFKPGWIPSDRAFLTTEITLEDQGDGTTLYTATARHWSDEAKQEHEAMGFHEGWGAAGVQLEALAQTL
ncbi:SRPBCC family protein [Pseudooceanicola algae]|uniref:Activator of Hsp90 ATPase homologue 1/2-like C-terminal domain-containing protein n=1 Tax=Pseudooceanicola algae TaxID=1537215 RepID=A0A418SK59_9RHOB|nr:SRPBCC family protein [Pseudooceanicola algae]QPM92167.1 hypothetical protein PSAL_034310 [Pseudooceanicola algae]